MITSKIKNLFLFIDFLHSNIQQFKKYNETLASLHLLDLERNSLNPRSNFKDNLQKDKIQIEIKDNFNIIKQNIIQPIENKANELNICDLENTESLWNWNISEIHEFQSNFETNDLPEINIHKEKYINYRNQTHKNYFVLAFFFNQLDETLKELFTYFQENEINEFESFEAKTIEKVENNNSEPKQQPTKAEILKTELGKYGFFELEKIKALSSEKTIIIIEKIAENGIPYAVAMFDYLGFISYLEINYFRTQHELIRKVSRWFNSDSEGRAIKGNINSLIIHSTENKARYTAFKHKEKVSLDYEQLK